MFALKVQSGDAEVWHSENDEKENDHCCHCPGLNLYVYEDDVLTDWNWQLEDIPIFIPLLHQPDMVLWVILPVSLALVSFLGTWTV